MDIDVLISMLRKKSADGSKRIYQFQAIEKRQTISADEIDLSDSKEESVKGEQPAERENPGIFDGSTHIWKM